ncbi:alpha/beta hydrolase domain-containing protein [Ramlibacter albus]|uniref:Alpha/beta hydrolase domain-containing protein n=1 Tax=Ramlibacter albus TaxID=2079448 RepID=A0A923M8W5_9BURK|nr:alpha/beta hydrolase domain-containing protein [Ramlibacter albus]MBC5766452.1 hypothetical protein [Ramlibacter albus]
MKSMQLLRLAAALAVTAAFHSHALADVTGVAVISSSPYGNFRGMAFTRHELRVEGQLVPEREAIGDLAKAKRNASGSVDYATRVTVVAPVSGGRGTLLVDIPNRGRPIAAGLLNGPGVPIGQWQPGNGFLHDEGFAVAAIAWELGHGIELPTVAGADGKPLFVEEAALSIVRDVAEFLKKSPSELNPLAGKVQRAIGFGYSQTGRFLKSFLLKGYNHTASGPLFEGLHIFGAMSGGIQLRTLAGPASGAGQIPTFEDPEFRGVAEEPLAVAQIAARAERSASRPPRMVFVNTTTDYFSLRASLGRTGGSGTQDLPLPGWIRVYDVAGASHALLPGRGNCTHKFAELDWHPVLRSTMLALDRWIATGEQPPDSVLMPLQAAATGSQALMAPKHLQGAVVQVPVLDADGNARGGIRLPELEVPLGSHAVQNPPLNFLCSLGAGYIPFKVTAAERSASGDARPSVAERYRDADDYAKRVEAAARALQEQRFLLPGDAAAIVKRTAAVDVFGKR